MTALQRLAGDRGRCHIVLVVFLSYLLSAIAVAEDTNVGGATKSPAGVGEDQEFPSGQRADSEHHESSELNVSEPADDEAGKRAATAHPFPRRLAALPFPTDAQWLNTDRPLPLEALRGRFVVLDFWTYCCINCMHVLPELKKLEHAYPDHLVVIGVHSAKFDSEKERQNIEEAILRYEIGHPVINDAEHRVWNAYGVQSWPTVLLIDPEGFVVYGRAGEFEFGEFAQMIKSALPYYRTKKVLATSPLDYESLAERAQSTQLRFPGKILADEGGNRLFIADSNHNRIVVATLEGQVLDTVGSGVLGRADGSYEEASFDHPQGMTLAGETLYVADTENHLLRAVDLVNQQVTAVAGTGEKGRGWPGIESLRAGDPPPDRWIGRPLETALNSPWALWHHDSNLYIAMAGPHQIWKMTLNDSEIGPYAGNGREDIVDGPLLPRVPYELGYSSFAQPSGLSGDEEWLYVADSEGSSIRAVPFDVQKETRTIVGTADLPQARLFTFGDQDGARDVARLQHVLGVVHHQGTLYAADTYNNKIKAIDAETGHVTTVAGRAGEFDEPAGISYAAGKLYVADTNNHRIRTVDLQRNNHVETLQLVGLAAPQKPVAEKKKKKKPSFPGAQRVAVKPQTVQREKGKLKLHVELKLPKDWKINLAAPMGYLLESVGEVGAVERSRLGEYQLVQPPQTKFDIVVPAADSGADRLQLSLNYYHCQGDPASGICKTGSVIWEIPIKIDAAAKQSRVEIKYDVPE